jgi:hypothetical protein
LNIAFGKGPQFNLSKYHFVNYMLRSLIRVTTRVVRPVALPCLAFGQVRFDFAKVSKKEKDTADKKKEKEKVKESLGGNVNQIDLNKYEEGYKEVISSYK